MHPLVAKLDISTAQAFRSAEALSDYHQNPLRGLRYGRDSSDATQMLEASIERIYPGFSALTFSSGMAAITTAMCAVSSQKTRLHIQRESYRKNRFLASYLYPHLWQSVEYFDPFGNDPFRGVESGCLFLEAPSNPHLKIPELTEIKKQAPHSLVVLDATFAGLGNESPLLLRHSDVIIHSLTKYANGHNDSIGGLVLVREGRLSALWDYRSAMGTILSPREASNIQTNLKTYQIRFERQTANAGVILSLLVYLQEKGNVEKIFYPGFGENMKESEIASQALKCFGSVITFVPGPSRTELEKRIADLRIMKMAPSFGSVDTLFEFPRSMSLAGLSDREVSDLGIADNLIRMAVGIENPTDLVREIHKFVAGSRIPDRILKKILKHGIGAKSV